ncbi:MAG: DUF5063 domain-containing protein [Anaerolineae bacterium]
MNKDLKLEKFTGVAREFCQWAESEFSTDVQSMQQALELITRLYLSSVGLIDELRDVDEATPSVESTASMRSIIYARASSLPVKYYSEVFNPLLIPAEEPVIGDLADDIADIYGDIRRGLNLFEAGYTEQAIWQWLFHMQHHWGEHATSAIRAIHWYLSEQHAFM